tara:strand:- start:7973 stop:8125 length:153 start_codon:yes stop_codon:yes gene_type:complete
MKYTIIGRIKNGNQKMETLDSAKTNEQAKFLLQEYQTAFGPTWELKIKKQ